VQRARASKNLEVGDFLWLARRGSYIVAGILAAIEQRNAGGLTASLRQRTIP